MATVLRTILLAAEAAKLRPQSTLVRVRISAGTHPVDSALVGALNRRRMAQDE